MMPDPVERDLVRHARSTLEDLLPAGWRLLDGQRSELRGPASGDSRVAGVWEVADVDGIVRTPLLVEAKRRIAPRDVPRVLAQIGHLTPGSQVGAVALVVAPWLSERVRQMIEDAGAGYLDLTGNVLLRVTRPGLYLRLTGASRDPHDRPRGRAALSGPRGGRLIRELIDFHPPYRSNELAAATELDPGYVSRLLTSLDEEALVHRRSGLVTDVDWAGLVRLRSQRYSLINSNTVTGYLSQRGPRRTYEDVAAEDGVVTGSFAASAIAAVAAPAQLMIYATAHDELADRWGLLPVGEGADVLLLHPADIGQLWRTREVDGKRHASVSQVAIDCLSGNGRLPAEGAALVDWMRADESAWRRGSLIEKGGR